MSNEAEVFNVLADGNGFGQALRQMVEGDAAAAKNGLIGFSYKDVNGDIVLPQLNAEGAIVVTTDSGTTKRDSAIIDSGSVLGRTLVAEIDILADKLYTCLSAHVACTRTTVWEVVYVDDAGGSPVETHQLSTITGAGDYGKNVNLLKDLLDTAGGTGDQKIRVYGEIVQSGNASDLHGMVSTNEIA